MSLLTCARCVDVGAVGQQKRNSTPVSLLTRQVEGVRTYHSQLSRICCVCGIQHLRVECSMPCSEGQARMQQSAHRPAPAKRSRPPDRPQEASLQRHRAHSVPRPATGARTIVYFGSPAPPVSLPGPSLSRFPRRTGACGGRVSCRCEANGIVGRY